MQSTEKKWILENYSKWVKGTWKMINCDPTKKIMFYITKNHLLLLVGNVTYECYSLSQNNDSIMVRCDENTHVFYTKYPESAMKFRILFKTVADARNCADELKKYIHLTYQDGHKMEKREETFSELVTRLMKGGSKINLPAPVSIPDDYPMESAIKLCILDPGFPNLVSKVETIINKFTEPDISENVPQEKIVSNKME